MSLINIPIKYENEINIENAGVLLAPLGKKAFIIAGVTAFEKAGEKLAKALNDAGTEYKTEIWKGYPTQTQAEAYGKLASEYGADYIIGVGGGRILDLAKAASEKAGLDVVTVPTISATCAAWSTLSVLYTDEGKQDIYFFRKRSPILIIVDKKLLLEAPERYIISGAADSIAKWYELNTNFNANKNDFALRLQLAVSKVILDLNENEYINAYIKGSLTQEILENTIDSNILLAGLAGSIEGKVPYGGLAHHFYNQSTQIDNPNKRLHGEVVIFGLNVQFAAEGRADDEIRAYLQRLKKLGLPVTLADLGLDNKAAIQEIAERMSQRITDYAGSGNTLLPELIERAIYKVDHLGKGLE